MRVLLCTLALLTLGACGSSGSKTTKQVPKNVGQRAMTGAYSQQRALKPEELKLFREVAAELNGVGYTPRSVSTQVVAGMNYRFICDAVTTTREPQSYRAEVVIYQPLPNQGEARITKITQLDRTQSGE